MKEIATITRIDGGVIEVTCAPREACVACNSPLCKQKEREFPVRNPAELHLSMGDLVEVEVAPAQAVWAGFLVLVFPLVLFVAGFLIAGFVRPEAPEGPRVLAGLVGLVLGFGVVFLTGRRSGSLPLVRRVVGAEEARKKAASQSVE